MLEFKKIDKAFETVELVCTKTDGTKYDFNRFFLPLKFIAKIHKYENTLDEAIEDQTKLKVLINKLNEYNPRTTKKVEEKERVLETARKLLDVKKDIIDLFEKGTFPYEDNVFKTKEKEELEEESEELEENKFFKYIENESKSINYDLFKTHFSDIAPTVLAKKVFETKKKKKNNDLVNVIKSGLRD